MPRDIPVGNGSLLWALWFHFDKFRDVEFAAKQYENLVIRCGDFLASYRDSKTGLPLPSYDLWEEKWPELKTIMRMKRSASSFAEGVQVARVSKERCCSAPEGRATSQNRNQAAIAVCVISGTNMN